MDEELSSSMTLYHKVVAPVLFAVGAGAAVFEGPRTLIMELLFVAVPTLLFVKMFGSIKRVRATANGLLVRGLSREIRIPYAQIARVVEHRWLKPRRAVITLRWPSYYFGSTIVFLPRLSLPLSTDSAATRLIRERAGLEPMAD